MKSQKGFTLIELLIVIAVIGILASVILVGLGPIQKQGRDARRISDLRQIQNGLELYYNRNSAYPTANWGTLNIDLSSVGVSNVPQDPSSPSRNYNYSSNGSSYCLGARLEDLNNPNFKRSVNCASGCFNPSQHSLPATANSNDFYCVSL
jgi:prepilin-type N-terminal cleavage/methylation domain-containing protein